MTVGWAKLPGTAIMLARPRAILPTRSSREAQELPHPLIPADTGIRLCQIASKRQGYRM